MGKYYFYRSIEGYADFASEEYAIAMRKGNEELLGKINQAIKQIKENGFYDGLIAKYFQ